MSKLFTLCFIIATFAGCNSKQAANTFQCPCSKIGLDSVWADSNKLTCYLVPVNKNSEAPEKGKYFLAVAVATSLNKTDEKPLLYLHGGPGIATLENLPRYLKNAKWEMLRAK